MAETEKQKQQRLYNESQEKALLKYQTRELIAEAENDEQFYNSTLKPTYKNQINKIAKGDYDREKSRKQWERVAQNYARKAQNDRGYGRRLHGGNFLYDKEVVKNASIQMQQTFEEDARNGEYDDLVYKKYRKKFITRREDELMTQDNSDQDTPEGYQDSSEVFYVDDEVIARKDIEEPDFMEKGQTWTHAKKGDKGKVVYVDSEGYPTVEFYNTRTVTIVDKKSEVKFAGDQIRESYLNQADNDRSQMNTNGPGKGWHGERMRHRDAALKRRMR